MQLIDGKAIADQIKQEIAEQTAAIAAAGGKQPHLAAILVGNDGASETYVGHKVKACEQVGFKSTLIRLPADATESQLMGAVQQFNNDADIDGFIVQLPLPAHLSEQKVIEAILPEKDVDGFHPTNTGRMMLGLPCFLPATPFGILELIKRNGIKTAGKNCAVVGRSNIVGTPVSVMLSRKGFDATVTLCHSRTQDLPGVLRQADIIILALGMPGFLTGDMVKEGAVVIDVGTTRVEDATAKNGWRLKGDAHWESVSPRCSYITPVPGGVGPMTIVSLLRNTLLAAKKDLY